MHHPESAARGMLTPGRIVFSVLKGYLKQFVMLDFLKSISLGFQQVFCFVLFFCSVSPTAYGGSQARDRIGAPAAGLRHSSRHRWILNPLSEARD